MTSDGGVQPTVFDEEPFNIRVHARYGYPLPPLAGGDGEGESGGGDEGSGDTDTFDAGGQGNDLYDLSSAPEELRPFLEEQLKNVQKNVGTRFEEAAAHRKEWEPYEGLGIRDVPMEELQELLSFRELLSDREGFTEWLKSAGESLGLTFGDGEIDDEEVDDSTDPSAAMQALLEEQLGPIKEFMASQQQQQAVGSAEQKLNDSLEALEKEHGEYDRSAVIALAHAYTSEDDPVATAFAEYQRITGGAQSDLLDTKADGPAGSLSGGQTDTSPPAFKGLNDPALKQAARKRFAST